MIDIQIVSGRDPAYIAEALRRLDQQNVDFELFIALNHDLPFDHPAGAIVRNEEPHTFEENHNKLAKLGTNPFILFLDDDAFLFPGALERMLDLIQDRSVAAVGAINNQTMPMALHGRRIPGYATLEEFQQIETDAEKVAGTVASNFRGQVAHRIFMPGNCLLVRRKAWQKEHGGWDEGFRNWNEEVDFLLWCRERGYQTLCAADVWFFHCQGRSRNPQTLLENIVSSAGHFNAKWSREKLARIAANHPRLKPEINELFNLNLSNSVREKVEASEYYRGATQNLPA